MLQTSEHNHSLDDTDEENHVLEPQENQEDAQGPLHVIRCGGEDGETGGPMSQRRKLNADNRESSLVRRGRGKVAFSLYFEIRFFYFFVDIQTLSNNFHVL